VKIAIIGCGVMGSAFASHFAKKHPVILCDHSFEKAKQLAIELGGEAVKTVIEAVQKAEMVVLAIKPKDLYEFARDTEKAFNKDHILVSILAGTSVDLLKKLIPSPLIIRAMPNLAFTCGKGVIGFVKTKEVSEEMQKKINELFFGLGLLPWLSEERLESLSALSGSGPAFVFLLIEAFIDGGVYLGFSGPEARDFVLQTMEGAIALLRESGKHPAELKGRITSPGGTTIAGIKVLEESGIRGVLMNTLIATFEKAKSLQH